MRTFLLNSLSKICDSASALIIFSIKVVKVHWLLFEHAPLCLLSFSLRVSNAEMINHPPTRIDEDFM